MMMMMMLLMMIMMMMIDKRPVVAHINGGIAKLKDAVVLLYDNDADACS